MTADLIADILISAMLVMAGIFGIVGSFGLIKLPDPMTRLHAPTKATTLGVGGVLIASMIFFGVKEDNVSFHELLITLFLFLTAPITANMIAKAHLHREVLPKDLPECSTGAGWAGFDKDSEPMPEAKD